MIYSSMEKNNNFDPLIILSLVFSLWSSGWVSYYYFIYKLIYLKNYNNSYKSRELELFKNIYFKISFSF